MSSNPYSVDSRPGIAKVPGSIAAAPVSGTFDPSILEKLSPEQQTLCDDFAAFVSELSAFGLTFSEKKQLSEAEKAVTVMTKKMAHGAIDESLIGQIAAFIDALKSRNYAGAQSIHTHLVNHEWLQHKDWLRGLKLLIQLSMKRFQ